ncbi:LysM peptidoglycan-binding domain-containing protein [Congregibacter litoralis]|uniref:LysM domain protein n=1 Tax=Congregibacter litoralis KT71 TaxID=314285 RepID=A4A933_9GAMM|nr:LysM domain-containing protein [Congregibacter litoralis]EAQ97575.1 LysM domain protein [Congregibacter litoralis KT71]
MTERLIDTPSALFKRGPALRCWWQSVFFVFALLLPGLSPAQDASVRSDAPESYLVKKGDTLWGIADMFLEEPWLWPEVWDVNPQIDNPHLIFPGDTLYLSYVDGRPRLSLSRGRDVKLTPNMRVTPLDLAIPVIPLDDIDAFLMRHRIIGPEELETSSYVVAGGQEHLITANGDTIYGRGYFPEDERAYGIYRAGDVYRDPLTLEVLGYQAQDIGNAQAKSSLSDPVVELEVTRVTEEVRITDRLLPLDERILDATFQPRAPGVDIEDAFMIAVDGGVTQIGTWDIVVLNKGAREGLEVGHVLAIYQTGEVVFDEVAQTNVSLPDVRAGLTMVFEVAEKASYALVLKSNRPLKVMDKVKNP